MRRLNRTNGSRHFPSLLPTYVGTVAYVIRILRIEKLVDEQGATFQRNLGVKVGVKRGSVFDRSDGGLNRRRLADGDRKRHSEPKPRRRNFAPRVAERVPRRYQLVPTNRPTYWLLRLLATGYWLLATRTRTLSKNYRWSG